jgi:uncharacterized protein
VWRSGDVVARREIWKGRVWTARPWLVVRDRPDELVLWIPRGTPTKIPPGSRIPRSEWTLEDGTWGGGALRLVRPGAAHSILHFFNQGEFRSWYVNLERPLQRSPVGFDYLDRELDVHVHPDGSWEYLDEDEFAETQRLGVIEADEAAAVRAEAERVLAAWPFPTGWEGWRPDPAWPVPSLPTSWDAP